MLPISSIIDDPVVKRELAGFAFEYHDNLIRERGLGMAKLILEAILVLHSVGVPLAVGFIAVAVEQRLGYEALSAKRCGKAKRLLWTDVDFERSIMHPKRTLTQECGA